VLNAALSTEVQPQVALLGAKPACLPVDVAEITRSGCRNDLTHCNKIIIKKLREGKWLNLGKYTPETG